MGWQTLDRRLGRQHGVVAVWQAVADGIPRSTFYDYVRRHGWTHLGDGLWATPQREVSFLRRIAEKQHLGPGARILTGPALLTVAGVRPQQPCSVDLLVGPRLAVAPRPGVRYHRGAWVSGDKVERREGIPSTPVLRAWTDATRLSSVDRLEKDLRAMDRLRIATPEQAAAYLELRCRFVGRPRARQAVARVDRQLVHSDDEARARLLLDAVEGHPHPRPCKISTEWRTIGEIDIAYCPIRYGIEVDGPHHEDEVVAARDRYRDGRLERLDWIIDRFSTAYIAAEPAEFIEAVREGAAKAAARGVEPWPCGVVH